MNILTGKIMGYTGQVDLPDGSRGYTTASIRYNILAMIPGASVPVTFTGQRPEIRLWPATQIIDADALNEKTCIGIMVNNDIRWHFFEPPMLAGCEDSGGRPGAIPEFIREEERRARAEAVGGAPASGATQTPGPGGVE